MGAMRNMNIDISRANSGKTQRAWRIAVAFVASAVSVVMVASLSACDGQVPKPAEVRSSQELPNVTMLQEKDIRLGLLRALEQANDEKNINALQHVVSGPALDVRTSELTIASKTGKLDPKQSRVNRNGYRGNGNSNNRYRKSGKGYRGNSSNERGNGRNA